MPPETREEWIIRQARERPASELAAFLDGACAGDAALRERLEALLAAHDQTSQATEPDAARSTLKLDVADAPDEAVGQTLGRYKLLERGVKGKTREQTAMMRSCEGFFRAFDGTFISPLVFTSNL